MHAFATALLLLCASGAHAQVPAPARVWMPFSHLGAGVTVGTTGLGLQVAAPYGAHWNLRAGVSYLGVSHTFQTSGNPVDGHVRLGAAQFTVDWFPRTGGFHVSLGLLAPNLTEGSARLALQPGKTITIEGVRYSTDAAHPLYGTASATMNKVAPLLTVGWGNLLPRNYHKRWTFPTELGVAYVGAPDATVATSGDVCDPQGCSPVASNLGFNQNVNAARREINQNLNRYAQFFPVITTGIGYRF